MIFADRLLHWFDAKRRSMPWRDDPSPYRVMVSEIMLQQTRVTTVIPYFERFVEELPNLQALAEVPDERLLVLWQGLGYYSRALNLKKAAGKVLEEHGGTIPDTKAVLVTLPGIGDYTAGAIASIAFGEKVTAIDGNVLRVFSRILNRSDDIALPRTKKEFEPQVLERTSEDRPGDFNQALMELGALVCLPKNPKCEHCPMTVECLAYAHGTQSALPVKGKAKGRTIEPMTVFLLKDAAQYGIRQRDAKGLLKKMWEFKNTEGHLSEAQAEDYLETLGYEVEHIEKGPSHTHIFSHKEWQMISYKVKVSQTQETLLWVAKEELAEYAIPSAFSFLLEEVR